MNLKANDHIDPINEVDFGKKAGESNSFGDIIESVQLDNEIGSSSIPSKQCQFENSETLLPSFIESEQQISHLNDSSYYRLSLDQLKLDILTESEQQMSHLNDSSDFQLSLDQLKLEILTESEPEISHLNHSSDYQLSLDQLKQEMNEFEVIPI
jgi:hypothetical protein